MAGKRREGLNWCWMLLFGLERELGWKVGAEMSWWGNVSAVSDRGTALVLGIYGCD